jgi:hypothetical protein
MAKQIVPNAGRDLIISMNYDATGLVWVELFDNAPLGWAVDDTDISHPEPVVVGSLPPAPADTGAIRSPQWAQYTGGFAVVPDLVRLSLPEFFNWLATNNGATRQVRSSMKSPDLANAYFGWSGGAASGSFSAQSAPAPDKPVGKLGDENHRDGERRQEQDQHHERHQDEPREQPRVGDTTRHTTAVEPMKASDLGEDHARSAQDQHRGDHGKHDAPGKPHEAKSAPHPSSPRR